MESLRVPSCPALWPPGSIVSTGSNPFTLRPAPAEWRPWMESVTERKKAVGRRKGGRPGPQAGRVRSASILAAGLRPSGVRPLCPPAGRCPPPASLAPRAASGADPDPPSIGNQDASEDICRGPEPGLLHPGSASSVTAHGLGARLMPVQRRGPAWHLLCRITRAPSPEGAGCLHAKRGHTR